MKRTNRVLCVPVVGWQQTREYVDQLVQWLDAVDLPFPLPAMAPLP